MSLKAFVRETKSLVKQGFKPLTRDPEKTAGWLED